MAEDVKPEGQGDPVFVIDTAASVPRSSTPRRVGGVKNAHDKRVDRVESLLTKVGAGVYVMDRFDGLCIIDRANEAAIALADLADENKQVAKMLDNLTVAGGYAAVFAVIASMIVPILARHGVLPGQVGMPAIEMLASENAKQEFGRMMAAQAERMAQANAGYSEP